MKYKENKYRIEKDAFLKKKAIRKRIEHIFLSIGGHGLITSELMTCVYLHITVASLSYKLCTFKAKQHVLHLVCQRVKHGRP